MDIKIVMHSELDCHLKPNLELLKSACEELIKEDKVQNVVQDVAEFNEFLHSVKMADRYINQETAFANAIKTAGSAEEKAHFLEQKKKYTVLADIALENALNTLAEAATTEISRNQNPKTMEENKRVAQSGGNAAKAARQEVEKQIGHSIVSPERASDYIRPIEDAEAKELPNE